MILREFCTRGLHAYATVRHVDHAHLIVTAHSPKRAPRTPNTNHKSPSFTISSIFFYHAIIIIITVDHRRSPHNSIIIRQLFHHRNNDDEAAVQSRLAHRSSSSASSLALAIIVGSCDSDSISSAIKHLSPSCA